MKRFFVKFYNMARINKNLIINKALKFGTTLFSAIGVLLMFITWEEFGEVSVTIKILILIGLLLLVLIVACIFVLNTKHKILWQHNSYKLVAQYGDILKIDEPNIIKVIPVNDTFETIVDENTSQTKPLVSANTLHGKWIKHLESKGIKVEMINKMIEDYFADNNIKEDCMYTTSEKARGNLKSYKIGTIVSLNVNGELFYLIAVSKFDKNNVAHSTREDIRVCIDKIYAYYDINGQGAPIYIPVFGTDRSRTGLSHTQLLNIFKSEAIIHEPELSGTINIVIYEGDREKVSLFD